MNEAQWLAAEDPIPMLAWLTGGAGGGQPVARFSDARPMASPRKLRLFACSCALLLPNRTLGVRQSVEAALAFADGELGGPEMEAARWDRPPGPWTVCDPDAGEAAYYVVRDDSLTGRRAEMAALLRDVFGNPFRPVEPEECYLDDHYCRTHGRDLAFVSPGLYRCPAGRAAFGARLATPAAQGIARRAYDERDFAALPVLADALEEGGCEDSALLMHLRGSESYEADPEYRPGQYRRRPLRGPHARGCWALDLVLGKS